MLISTLHEWEWETTPTTQNVSTIVDIQRDLLNQIELMIISLKNELILTLIMLNQQTNHLA